MDRSTLARTGIAGAVAGLGLTAGGIAMASAESKTADATISSSAHPGGPRGDRGHIAEILAEELGLEEEVVQDALTAVRDELRPDRSDKDEGAVPEQPTDEERAERQAAFAAALAEELDVSEAKVAAALDALHQEVEAEREERRADGRERLVERLDAAIEDGTLTAADKASVLKAFDAELIGDGFGGGPGRHGPVGGAPTT
jgi:hypothetical protein